MASRLTSLKDRQAEIAKAQQANAGKLEDATLTAAARATIVAESKALQAEFETVCDEIAVLEQAAAAQKRQIADGTQKVRVEVRDRVEDDPRRGFKSLAEFAMLTRSAVTNQATADQMGRLYRAGAPTNVMQEAGGVSGEGFLVPPQFRQEIFQLVFADEGILQSLSPEPTDSNSVEFNGDETTPWGSTGVTASWRAEITQMTATPAVTKPRIQKLHELFAFVTADGELLQDAARLNDRLTAKAGAAIRWKAEEALVNGDGVGKPLGIASSKNASLVVVAKDSGQAASTVTILNLGNMFSRLLDRDGAFWLIHPSVIPALLALNTSNGFPVFIPNNQGITGGLASTLLGLPIKWSTHSAALTSQGDIILVGPRGYYASVKSGGDYGMKFDMSLHLFFDYNVAAFRWIFRLGGQPFLSAAVSPAKGSNTLSHCIALASR